MAGPQTTTEVGGEWRHELMLAVAADPARVGNPLRRAARVQGDLMFGELIGSDGTKGATSTFRKLSEPGASTLAGAWELVSDGQQGFMVFTDEHFNIYMDPLDRPTLDAANAYASEWASTARRRPCTT